MSWCAFLLTSGLTQGVNSFVRRHHFFGDRWHPEHCWDDLSNTPFFGDALTVCVLWCLSISLISRNSLLKPALPEESMAMSFRRDETGSSATREGAIERPKYRAAKRKNLQRVLRSCLDSARLNPRCSMRWLFLLRVMTSVTVSS